MKLFRLLFDGEDKGILIRSSSRQSLQLSIDSMDYFHEFVDILMIFEITIKSNPKDSITIIETDYLNDSDHVFVATKIGL